MLVNIFRPKNVIAPLIAIGVFALCALTHGKNLSKPKWQIVETQDRLVKRHEAALIAHQNSLIVLGGRGDKPVNILNLKTLKWAKKSLPPIEIHHFQPVTYKNKIYIVGAMTGPFPNETPIENIIIYNPKTDTWKIGDKIPKARRRGGAGVVLYNNKIYVAAGITRGHMGGHVKWLDEYDPETGKWRVLPDAPHARDHFQAAVINGQLYSAGGRRTSHETGELFTLLVPKVDVYNFDKKRWSTLPSPAMDLPTLRAGTSTIAVNGRLIVAGGESARKSPAHNEVEIYDPGLKKWLTDSPLVRGRHGTGLAVAEGFLWTCCGSGNRGGGPELLSTERLKLEP